MTTAQTAPASRRHWHHLPADHALTLLEVDRRSGLTDEEVTRRQQRYGLNRLAPAPARSALIRFLLQFHNVLIYVLLGAAAVTIAIGDQVDTAVILGVVVINAVIGFVQEGKAEAALRAIRDMLSPSAVALRNEERITIPADQLVPGDIVFLQSGDRVPADLRMLEVRGLRVNEAALTGESEPVEKSVLPVQEDASLGDRLCMGYSGTLVTYGQAVALVVATGAETEIGRIGTLLTHVETLTTPLQRQMEDFGRRLTIVILLLAVATFTFGAWARGYSLHDMFLAVVGLAVAAIPEGLPAIVTITLAVGVQRMAKRKAIIRSLPAVETLGSVTVICSDKTGTLTRNEMTVQALATADGSYTVSGVGYAPHGGFWLAGQQATTTDHPELIDIAHAALLCNDAIIREVDGKFIPDGDPTEAALVTLGLKASVNLAQVQQQFPRIDAIPFESEHRFMASLHHDRTGRGFIFLKGAPEVVLERCNRQRCGGQDQPLDATFWHGRIQDLAAQGQRVLALATALAPPSVVTLTFDEVAGGLTLLGLCGLIDPPREEAIRAVGECRDAGIRVKMITGDHAVTARAIGRQLSIGDGRTALTGAEIENLSDADLRRITPDIDVFARASPEHKLRLVQALQANGHVVAMTGDGVNDAPALKRADVGVAMGLKGTEAAKDAAAMVLADDNFASIAHAVEEGRTVYDNLRKAIVYILPTSFGEAGAIIIAILLGWTMPITPLQILWVNMVTAITLSLTLAFEPPEDEVMRRPPRDPKEPLLTLFLAWRVLFVSLLLVLGLLGLFLWESAAGSRIEVSRTAAINALVAGEIAYLFNSRYLYASVLSRRGLFGNRYVLWAIAVLMALQGLFSYTPPFQELFGTAALDAGTWSRIAGFGVVTFVILELEKSLLRRAHRALRETTPGALAKRALHATGRGLAVAMLGLVGWQAVHSGVALYPRLATATALDTGALLAAFCTVMAVLVAVEICVNLTLRLRGEIVAFELVLALALLAMADAATKYQYAAVDLPYLAAFCTALLALLVAYWGLVLAYAATRARRDTDHD